MLFDYILDFYGNNLMELEKFKKLLFVLIITQKGLTIDELKMVTKITDQEWKMFITCFKTFLQNFKDLWVINNSALERAIVVKFGESQEDKDKLHKEIAEVLEKITPNSIRKLEEQTFHLFKSKSYFELKELISAIENFLLLFNPNNKYDLCRFW